MRLAALVRRLRPDESAALEAELRRWPAWVSSALLSTEAVRACRRLGERVAADAETSLDDVALIPVDGAVLAAAGRPEPTALRTLDAIHLATALSLGGDLGALFTYDARLAAAAHDAGLEVRAPAG
ncbi:MAG: PIN domain-containing protein [Actinomycetota bacterium]|nr:PIN domain-containing protein [Actinomycetota bacterium]